MGKEGEVKQQIRGIWYSGNLYNLTIELIDITGSNLRIPATVFIPNLKPNEKWSLPSFIGYLGCLNRFRFALDPENGRFYFGGFGIDELNQS